MVTAVLQSRQQVIPEVWNGVGGHAGIWMTIHLPAISESEDPGLSSSFYCFRRAACTVNTAMDFPPLPVPQKALMFLWYMANQNSYREMSDNLTFPRSTAHTAILQVLTIMSGIVPTLCVLAKRL